MFKPHYGTCTKCTKGDRLIVVKKGYCDYCNRTNNLERKKTNDGDEGRVRLSGDESDVPEHPEQPGETDQRSFKRNFYGKKKSNVFGGWKRKSPIKVRKKKTGEWDVFMVIWKKRKHVCQCCPQELGDEPIPTFFSHVLSKGAYSFFRLYELNIMLMCPACHHEWEFGDKSQDKFKLARMIAEKLKRMYYVNRNSTDPAGGGESTAPADTQ